MLNKWRRLVHSSRVKLPLVKMSASWCLVSRYRSNLNFRIKINPVNQPIQRNSVGSWHMSHCGTSAFDYHLNHGFINLKDIQQSIGTIMCSAWWNVINIGQIEIGVRSWNLLRIFDWGVADRFTAALLHLWLCWFDLVRNEILQSLHPKDRERESHPCVNLHREKEF